MEDSVYFLLQQKVQQRVNILKAQSILTSKIKEYDRVMEKNRHELKN